MIDIHCHTLFGVDDGPTTLAEAIQMLEIAKENRIREMILTPHYRKGMFSYPHDRIEANYAALEAEAVKYGIRLHPGCEYYADHEIVENFRNGRCMTLAGSEYILVEFHPQCSMTDIRGTVNTILSAGFYPVIAHAERYEVIRKRPEVLAKLRSGGAMIQLNAGSVLGDEGRQIKAACTRILRDKNVDIIASDAHNMHSRSCSRMRECGLYIAKKYGKSTARALFRLNPERILENA